MRFRKKPPQKCGLYWILWPGAYDYCLNIAEVEDFGPDVSRDVNLKAGIIGLEDLIELDEIPFWGDPVNPPERIKTKELDRGIEKYRQCIPQGRVKEIRRRCPD